MARVRIICISDTHGQHAGLRVPDGDILIHAGDFMTYGNAPREIIDFKTWLGRQPHAHKIVIAGNHDRLVEAANIAVRFDPDFRKEYSHRCHQKHFLVAKVAAARKLAIRMYWILRTQKPYPQVLSSRAA